MNSVPSKRKKVVEEGLIQLEKAIEDQETMKALENVIQSFSKLDKTTRWAKESYLLESLTSLCGAKGTEVILNLLNRGSSKGSVQLIETAKSPAVKKFLNDIMLKYGAMYQWFLEPFQEDWQRYNFSVQYQGIPPLPLISTKIICKSGRLLEFESPLPSYVDLLVAQVGLLKGADEGLKKLGSAKGIKGIVEKGQLKKMKEIIDKLLEEDVDKSS